MVVVLPAPLQEEILAHALRTRPEECCGILLGEIVSDEVRVDRVRTARNVAKDRRRRFSIDVRDLFEAHRDARREGREVVGYYHSHPDGAPIPSATDRNGSFPGLRHLIVGLAEPPAIRAWSLGEGEPSEEAIRPC